MFKILHIAKNEYFLLPSNIKVPMNIFNPFFEEQGSMSYGATLSSKEAINKRLVDYNHLPGNLSNAGYKIPVRVYLFGSQKKCLMQILSADDEEIKFNLLFDEGTFMANVGDLNIKEFNLGGEQTIPSLFEATALPDWDNEIYTKSYPEVKVAFPLIWASNYWSGSKFEDIVANTPSADANRYLNYPGNLQVKPNNLVQDRMVYPIVPCPFLAYVIEQIFIENDYNIAENEWLNEELINLILLNVKDTSEYKIFMNNGSESGFSLLRSKYYIKNHLPSISVKDLFKELKNKFNIHNFIDEETKTVRFISLEKRLKETVFEDLSEFFTIPQLKSVKEYTGIHFLDKGDHQDSYNNNRVDKQIIDDFLGSPEVNNLTELEDGEYKYGEVRIYKVLTGYDEMLFGELYRIGAYYRLFEDDTDDNKALKWQFIGYVGFDDYITGTDVNPLKIESKVTQVPDWHFQYPGIYINDEWHIILALELSSEGNSQLKYSEESDIGLNLAFYNKFEPQFDYNKTNGVPMYYVPTAYNYNLLSNNKVSLLSLGENGIANNCWKNTFNLHLNRGRLYEAIPSFPANKLFSIDLSRKYLIHGGVYMIKNLKPIITNSGIEYDKCELIEC